MQLIAAGEGGRNELPDGWEIGEGGGLSASAPCMHELVCTAGLWKGGRGGVSVEGQDE